MGFRTKINFQDNRQHKLPPREDNTLSGTTIFGVPFSDLETGPDPNNSGTTDYLVGLIFNFSGNSTTTNFDFPVYGMDIVTLQPITSDNDNQVTGNVFVGNDSTLIDGNLVYLNYTGISYDLDVETITETSPNVYTGTVIANDVYYLSAGTLDYTGRTIWSDVIGTHRTEKIIISEGAQYGYVLTSTNNEGDAEWLPVGGISASTFWEAGDYGNVSLKNINGNHYLNSDYSIIGGGSTNTINGGSANTIVGGSVNNITTSSYINGIFNGAYNLISGSTISTIIGGLNNTILNDASHVIIGGNNNLITDAGNGDNFNTIINGGYNTISSDYSIIGGGYQNEITGEVSSKSGIIGGEYNYTNSESSFIGGGSNNSIDDSRYSTIIGGDNNYIDDSRYSAIITSKASNIRSTSSVVNYNMISNSNNSYILNSDYSNIIGGIDNEITGSTNSGLINCTNVTIDGVDNSIAIGCSNINILQSGTTYVNKLAIVSDLNSGDTTDYLLLRNQTNGEVRETLIGDLVLARDWGTTIQRPVGVGIGYTYFDTTLGYRIDYNGTNWVDWSGGTV